MHSIKNHVLIENSRKVASSIS